MGSDSRAMGYLREVTMREASSENIWYLETLYTDGDPSGKVGMRAYGCAADNETPNAQLEELPDIPPNSIS